MSTEETPSAEELVNTITYKLGMDFSEWRRKEFIGIIEEHDRKTTNDLRDKFACQAMAICIQENSSIESVAIQSYKMADAMLKERAMKHE